MKQLEKKKSKLENEITNNQKLLQDKLADIVKLDKAMENLKAIKLENNFVINI
jgi:hypothetical protein